MIAKILTKAEEQVMQAIWKLQKPAGLREIIEAMPEPRPHTSTVATMLKILGEKGFVQTAYIGRMNFYSPTLTADRYSSQRLESIATSYFDGSFSKVISSLVKNKKVSISDLELLVEQLKNREP